MNEQDSWTITLENFSTSVYRFKFYIKENSNSGDHFGYSVQFSINKGILISSLTRMRMDIQTTTKWSARVEPLFHLIFPLG